MIKLNYKSVCWIWYDAGVYLVLYYLGQKLDSIQRNKQAISDLRR